MLEQNYSDEQGRELNTADRPASTITLTLEDLGEKTKLTVVHRDMASRAVPIHLFKQGWGESLDRLVESLKRG